MRGRGGKIQKKKRNTTEEEGSSSQVNEQNGEHWKKFNIWYRKLRYWRHHSIPHCIDFMHVEKNVAESLVGTLLNVPGKTKDGVNARLDLAELGVKPELFVVQEEDKTTLPPAGYTLTNAEKDIFYETLYNIRVPQGFCSNFSSLVSLKDRKLIVLKSHDYHMLMQEFLPIVIRSIMHPATRYAIIRFGNTAYLHISVAFIQMLKALMPVATLIMAILCGIDKLSWHPLPGHRHLCRSFEASVNSSPPAKEGFIFKPNYKLILHSSMQISYSASNSSQLLYECSSSNKISLYQGE
ncbi:putative transposase-associated domain-containing protein, partial [Tanacetum coccineum]